MDADEWLDDLDAFVAEGVVPEDGTPVEPPQDTDRANRLLRARQKLLRDKAGLQSTYDSQRQLLEDWFADRTGGIDRAIESLDRALEGFMRGYNTLHPKVKSLPLPNGKLKLRAQGRTSVRITDKDAFMAWAVKRDDSERFVRHPDPEPLTLTQLAAALEAGTELQPVEESGHTYRCYRPQVDGEIVPGVELRTQADLNFGIES